ncbi:MAG: LamG-like jellyroll fold domain-containing protein [Alphaproteobacteria bacterium]
MLYRIGRGFSRNKSNADNNLLYQLPAAPSGGREVDGVAVHDFDGDDFIDLGLESFADGTSLFAEAGQSWTVSTSGVFDENGYFIAKAGLDPAQRSFGIFRAGDDVKLYARGHSTYLLSGYTPSEKINITVTWNGSVMRAYLNNDAPVGVTVGAAAEEVGQRIIIGARSNGTGYFLDGALQNVMIYNRALNATEVAQHHTMFG